MNMFLRTSADFHPKHSLSSSAILPISENSMKMHFKAQLNTNEQAKPDFANITMILPNQQKITGSLKSITKQLWHYILTDKTRNNMVSLNDDERFQHIKFDSSIVTPNTYLTATLIVENGNTIQQFNIPHPGYISSFLPLNQVTDFLAYFFAIPSQKVLQEFTSTIGNYKLKFCLDKKVEQAIPDSIVKLFNVQGQLLQKLSLVLQNIQFELNNQPLDNSRSDILKTTLLSKIQGKISRKILWKIILAIFQDSNSLDTLPKIS